MALKINHGTESAQDVKVLLLRQQGSLFYAGPAKGTPRAKAGADSLGTQIKGREGFYPLVASFLEGQTLSYEGGVDLNVGGATATIAISEDDLVELNSLGGNAWVMRFKAFPSAPNTQNPGSRIHGSVWLEVAGNEMDVDRPKGLVTDAALAQAALNQNAELNAQRRSERQGLARMAAEASAPQVKA